MPDYRFFEYWSQLAAKDPERFERERKEALEKNIAKMRPWRQERWRWLQQRIDQERAKARTYLGGHLVLKDMLLRFITVEKRYFYHYDILRNPNEREGRILQFTREQ